MSIENMNYYNDRRVCGANNTKWYQAIDEKAMTATVSWDNEDGEPVEKTVPFRWDVCPTCEGKGRHVNPGIDANGLTSEDFYDDPDFAEDYARGVYDVACYECGGRRVVPVINLSEEDPDYKSYLRSCEIDAAYDAEVRMERMMGA
ncbi:MAG: hypothetical protein M0036_19130 [Desulfobacteraceae bacterium]|nr:hypothetical protein [Desulfobacteraceae bacterium]